MRRRGLILSLITSLKQLCDHPFLYHKRGDASTRLSGKAVRATELLSESLDVGEKALVFTQYMAMGGDPGAHDTR